MHGLRNLQVIIVFWFKHILFKGSSKVLTLLGGGGLREGCLLFMYNFTIIKC